MAELTEENIIKYIASEENVNKLINKFFTEKQLEKPQVSFCKFNYTETNLNGFYIHIKYCYFKHDKPDACMSYYDKFKHKEINVFLSRDNILNNMFMINCGMYHCDGDNYKKILFTTDNILKSDEAYYKNENIILLKLDRAKFANFYNFDCMVDIEEI